MPHSQSVELKFQLFFEIPDASKLQSALLLHTATRICIEEYNKNSWKRKKKVYKRRVWLLLVGRHSNCAAWQITLQCFPACPSFYSQLSLSNKSKLDCASSASLLVLPLWQSVAYTCYYCGCCCCSCSVLRSVVLSFCFLENTAESPKKHCFSAAFSVVPAVAAALT